MKYLIGLALCVFLVVAVSCESSEEDSTRRTRGPRPSRPPRPTRPTRPPRPTRPTLPPPNRCDSSDDCEADECCTTHDMFGFRKGVCLKLANEGKRCSLKERVMKNKYLHSCPCVEGLSCEPERIKTIPFVGEVRINERCVNPNNSTSRPEVEGTVDG